MKYRIDVPHFGKFFTVPCSAVENYIKVADGNYVKVLLCLLCSNSTLADVNEIADSCGLSVSAVEDGILFWQNCGVISAVRSADENCNAKSSANTSQTVHTANTANTAQPTAAKAVGETHEALPVCVTDAVNPMKNTAAAKSVIRYSNKEIAEKVKENHDLKTMFDEVERILAKPLNGTITAGLINIYEYYGFDVPSIVMIAEYSRSVGKTSIAYIETVAKDWFSRGITDFTQVEQEIIRLTEQHNFEVEVAHRLGIEGKLTKQQRDFISQWKDWGFDVRLIELAGDECRNKKNTIKLPYVNGILGRWKQDNLFTEQAIMEHNEKFRSKYSQNQQSDGKNGNAPSAEKSYDLNQWRDMAAAFNPNTLGFEEDDDI